MLWLAAIVRFKIYTCFFFSIFFSFFFLILYYALVLDRIERISVLTIRKSESRVNRETRNRTRMVSYCVIRSMMTKMLKSDLFIITKTRM